MLRSVRETGARNGRARRLLVERTDDGLLVLPYGNGAERTLVPEGGELDTAFWRSLIDQVADSGCLNLLITGGEPLLRRSCRSPGCRR